MGRCLFPVVLAVAACGPGTPHAETPPPPVVHDAAPARPVDAAAPDAAPPPPVDAATLKFTRLGPKFPFDELYKKWDAFKHSPRRPKECDWRVKDIWPEERRFACTDSPGVHAAYVIMRTRDGDRTILTVSIGFGDFIDANWQACLLDAYDFPITPWLPIKILTRSGSSVEVALPLDDIGELDHVAMRSDHDPNPRHEWPQLYP